MVGSSTLVEFRVFPEMRRKEYYTVKLFRSRRGMFRYCRENCPTYREGYDYHAICHSFTKLKNGRELPEIGEIHFYKGFCRARGITHECSHAALFWWEKVRGPLRELKEMKQQERFCHALDCMVGQIVDMGWKVGLYGVMARVVRRKARRPSLGERDLDSKIARLQRIDLMQQME